MQGHQIAFWVMNDAGGPHNRTGSKPLGVEVRVTAMAFRSPSDALNFSTAYRYEIINRTSTPITETYLGLWADPDLGNATDDLVGSDSALATRLRLQRRQLRRGQDGYGSSPPAFGFAFLDGSPRADGGRGFSSFLDIAKGTCGGRQCEPLANSADYYRFASGRWKDGALPYACGDGNAAQYAPAAPPAGCIPATRRRLQGSASGASWKPRPDGAAIPPERSVLRARVGPLHARARRARHALLRRRMGARR